MTIVLMHCYFRSLVMDLNEGRNRQIHRMLNALGYTVTKLHRTVFAGIGLVEGSRLFQPGDWCRLSDGERNSLKQRLASTTDTNIATGE